MKKIIGFLSLITLLFCICYNDAQAFTTAGGDRINSYEDLYNNFYNYHGYYGKEYVSGYGFYDHEIWDQSYIQVNYPAIIHCNKMKSVYARYYKAKGYDTGNFGGKINLFFTDGTHYEFNLDNESNYKLNDSKATLLFEDEDYITYKLDLSSFKNKTINQMSIIYFNNYYYDFHNSTGGAKYISDYATIYYNDEYPDNFFEDESYDICFEGSIAYDDLVDVYYAWDEVDSYGYQGFFFDTATANLLDICMLDSLEMDDNNNLYINTFETSSEAVNDLSFYTISIDNKTYNLTEIEDTKYKVNSFNVAEKGQHMYNIDSFSYGGYVIREGKSEEFRLQSYVDEEFVYETRTVYYETTALVLTNVDDPMWGWTHTYAYIALFNREHGRLRNVVDLTLEYDHRDSFDKSKDTYTFKRIKFNVNIDCEYDSDNFDNGQVRKLYDWERAKSYFWEKANFAEKALATLGNIDSATFDYDYEFKIKGYLKNNETRVCFATYLTEEGELCYASCYKNALNWDDQGNVYNGMGELQPDLKFDGITIKNVATGEEIKPENNSIFDASKKDSFANTMKLAVETAAEDGEYNFFDKIKDIFENVKNGASSVRNAILTIFSIISILIIVIIIRKIYKAFKN